MNCPYCKNKISDESLFCPKCGQPICDQEKQSTIFSTYWNEVGKERAQDDKKRIDVEKKTIAQKKKKNRMFLISLIFIFVTSVILIVFISVDNKDSQNLKETIEYCTEEETSFLFDTYMETKPFVKETQIDETTDLLDANIVSDSDSQYFVENGLKNFDTEEAVLNESEWHQACYEPPLDVNGDYLVLIKNVSSNLNVREEPKHDSKLVDIITDDSDLFYYGEWSEGIGSDGKNHIWCKIYNIQTPGWVRSDLVLTTGKYYQKGIDSSINLRALPKHDSDLVAVVSDASPMYFYGETEIGLGSDEKEHEWYKVYLGDGITGWVRSDLVEEGQ